MTYMCVRVKENKKHQLWGNIGRAHQSATPMPAEGGGLNSVENIGRRYITWHRTRRGNFDGIMVEKDDQVISLECH